jgi:hypothetical protein
MIAYTGGLGLFFQEYGGQYIDACNVSKLASREIPPLQSLCLFISLFSWPNLTY